MHLYDHINIIYSLIHVPWPTKADKLVLTQTAPVPGRSFPAPQLPTNPPLRRSPSSRLEVRGSKWRSWGAARRRGGTGGEECSFCEVCRPERFDFKRPPQKPCVFFIFGFAWALGNQGPETSTPEVTECGARLSLRKDIHPTKKANVIRTPCDHEVFRP